MAIQLMSTNGNVQYNIDEYAVDSPDELEKLPKKSVMGSVAICTSTGDIYIKNGSGKWVVL